MFQKWAHFSKKAKGLTLLIAPKIDISEMGLLLQKSKGVNLTFCPKNRCFRNGPIFPKKQRG